MTKAKPNLKAAVEGVAKLSEAYVDVTDKKLDPNNIGGSLLDRMPDPTGWRLLILPYRGKGKTDGGIFLPDQTVEEHTISTQVGYVLKTGPLAYQDPVKFESGPWCEKGDWVMFARYAQQVQSENSQFKQRIQNMDQNYVSEYSNRVETQISSTEAELARAVELGDSAQVVEAQKKLTQLAIENDRAQQAKVQQERYAQQVALQQQAAYQQQLQQPQATQTQQAYKEPDPKAQKWAEKNEWFGSDEAMTYAAFGIHKKLIEDEGFDPSSDEYYSELDSRMVEEFPHKLDPAQNDKRGSKRSAQNVASVSRSTGGRSRGKKVRLTPSQISIAKKLGVPLEEYAKYVKE
jgi:co-chaperonin GroES (HSP10)